jgi:hypothetical protein
MIPKENISTQPYLREIANAVKNECSALVSTNMRFYVVDLDAQTGVLKATIHVCCGGDSDAGVLLSVREMFSKAIVSGTRFKKIVWE